MTIRQVWAPNPNQWDNPVYRDQVAQFVTSRIPGSSYLDATVWEDETDGTRALITTSFFNPDGSFHTDPRTGQVVARQVVAELPEGTRLP